MFNAQLQDLLDVINGRICTPVLSSLRLATFEHSNIDGRSSLFVKTIIFRPYVFVFLAAFLFSAIRLIGWPRTWRFWLISWVTAFVCEFSSTRNGIPFGWYHYNGSTVGTGAVLLQHSVHGLDLVLFPAVRHLLPRTLSPPSNRALPCSPSPKTQTAIS